MGSTSTNSETPIIEIEDDVIDLDETEKTAEEVIYEWDAVIRKKFSNFSITDSIHILEDLMREYLRLLQEMARSYEDNETLKKKVYCHIGFLHSYYFELECCTPEIYLNIMEDILTIYCNLELEVIRPMKRKDFVFHKYTKRIVAVARRIITVLTVYLLDRHDHILHVLIKMNTNKISDSCSDVLKILYIHFLTKVPATNLSDESFCRHYIVFQKWKEIRKMDDWEEMDKTMYKMFKRTPESIKRNETLRQILMPPCTSTIDIVMNLFQSLRAISTAYFKHISAKKTTELEDIDFNIDLGDDEPTVPSEDENDEEVQFLKAFYHFERNMSNLPHATDTSDNVEIDIFGKCKEEFDEDDDVQFIDDILPPRSILNFTVNSDNKECELSNMSNNSIETEDTPLPPIPLLVPSAYKEKDPNFDNVNGVSVLMASPSLEKNPELENLNGISRLLVGSPRTVIETPDSCQTAEVQQPIESSVTTICTISQVTASCDVATETNEPEVPLITNKIPLPSPSSPEKIIESISDSALNKRTLEMKSVEVQADNTKEYLYNGYGLTTPPFDVENDEQISRPVEPRLYTNIGQKNNGEKTRSIEVQVDPPPISKDCPYDDYGLTPPNDLEDHSTRLQEPLYTNIGHKDLNNDKVGEKFSEFSPISAHNSEIPQDTIAQNNKEVETENHNGVSSESERVELEFEADESIIAHIPQHESDYDDSEDQLDISEMDPTENEEINVEMSLQENKDSNSDQIDTGQKTIQNSAPNIPVTADSEIEDLPTATLNGNTILKPLVSSNRTNGQAKDSTSTKIMYTSSQRIRPIPLDKFTMFESAINSQWNTMKENHDFDDILSGPVSKIVPVKQNSLLTSSEKLDPFDTNSKSVVNSNSCSNSPNEMTSPAYEAIDDFRKYFNHNINGHVPPSQDRIPPGILKKSNAPKRSNRRIMFHESTFDKTEERKPRGDGVMVPKRVRRDPKLNLEPRVVLERLSYIESKMKKLFNNPPTLRIDYDKTTPHINEKDVVRCLSPPRITWIVPPSRNNSGKVKSFIDLDSKKSGKTFTSTPQLSEKFSKLNCDASDDKALNLTIPEPPTDPETEFSNSPKFLPNSDVLVQHALEETSVEVTVEVVERKSSLLCDNSNFYESSSVISNLNLKKVESPKNESVQSNNNNNNDNSQSNSNLNETFDESLLQLPTPVPESYDFEKNFKNEVFSKIDWQTLDDSDGETRLPLKKRKLSVASDSIAEEQKKEEISYPATPMISIAEVEALHPRKLQNSNARPFKTPAERKEMPPLPVFYNVDNEPSPIITDQFNINNHTYNNPTINYHMNNVPVPFINIPCGSYYSLPPILVPFNNVSNFDQSKLNIQQQETYVKKETKKHGRQRRHQ